MADRIELIRRQRVLYEFGDFVLDHDNLDAVLNEGCRLIAQALGADLAKVIEIEPEAETGFVRAGVGWNDGIVGQERISLNERSSEAFAIERSEPVISNNIATEDRFTFPAFLVDHGVIALVNVPIFLPGRRPWGVLQVDARRIREFDQEDIEFLKTYSMVLGPVIDRFLVAAEREEARHGLAKREEWLGRVLDGMGEAFGILGPDFTILEQNREALRLDGRAKEEVVGRSHWDVYPGTEESELGRLLKRAMAERVPVSLEHQYVWSEDRALWLEMRAFPTTEGGLVVFWRDVTNRKRTEEALQETELRYLDELEQTVRMRTAELQAGRDLLKATMDASIDMIQVFDAVRDESGAIVDFRWVLINHEAEKWFGDATGDSLIKRNPGVVTEGIFDAFKRVTETGITERAERHYAHEQFNGWFHQSAVKLGDSVATTTTDISDWKAAQADLLRLQDELAQSRLRESEERFHLLVNSVRDYAIFTAARDGTVTSWPAGAAAVFGWSEEEMVGASIDITFVPEDLADNAPATEIETALRDGWAPNIRWHRRKDGSRIFIDGSTQPLRSADGVVREFIKIGQDVTERKQWEERQKVLVGELQHRTRNLMSVVRSVAEQTTLTSADLPDFRARFRDRLDALARVQGLLSRLGEHDRVAFDELIRSELSAVGGIEKARLEGPSGMYLRSSTVQMLAMALHEMATNAVKYGALGQADARLAVRWALRRPDADGKPWLDIDWVESGVTMPDAQATQDGTGQGRQLIERALPYQLGAETNYRVTPDGVHCTISIPISAMVLTDNEDH